MKIEKSVASFDDFQGCQGPLETIMFDSGAIEVHKIKSRKHESPRGTIFEPWDPERLKETRVGYLQK